MLLIHQKRHPRRLSLLDVSWVNDLGLVLIWCSSRSLFPKFAYWSKGKGNACFFFITWEKNYRFGTSAVMAPPTHLPKNHNRVNMAITEASVYLWMIYFFIYMVKKVYRNPAVDIIVWELQFCHNFYCQIHGYSMLQYQYPPVNAKQPLLLCFNFHQVNAATFSTTMVFDLHRRFESRSKEISQIQTKPSKNMDVSKNYGTPKSSILIGFSIINHPFCGTPIFGNTQIKHLNHLLSFHKISRSTGGGRCWWVTWEIGAFEACDTEERGGFWKRIFSGSFFWLNIWVHPTHQPTWQTFCADFPSQFPLRLPDVDPLLPSR